RDGLAVELQKGGFGSSWLRRPAKQGGVEARCPIRIGRLQDRRAERSRAAHVWPGDCIHFGSAADSFRELSETARRGLIRVLPSTRSGSTPLMRTILS